MDDEDLRRQIKRRFDLKQITLQQDALIHITNNVKGKSDSEIEVFINKLIGIFEKEKVDDQPITLATLERCLRLTFGKNVEKDNGFKMICAPKWPKEVYDPLTRTYIEDTTSDDENVEICRYNRIRDHVTNNSLLRIELLYSRTNAHVDVLGKLRRHHDGYGIEDPTGLVKLSMNDVVFGPGLFFEGGVYEFTGVYKKRVFHVENISLPTLKPEAPLAKHRNHAWSSKESIVVLSDAWLDDEKVLSKIHMILNGFSDIYAIILCGNFISPGVSLLDVPEALENGLRHLNNVIKDFGKKYSETQIVIVPHAEDYPQMLTAPRPPMAPSARLHFDNFHYGTNPCKLKVRDQNIVIYRDNVIQKACRHALNNPPDIKETHKLFCETILSQNHYCPLPPCVSPIIPQLDYQFTFTPIPDLLILADNFTQYDFKQENSINTILNPGSFAQSGFDFAVYYPATRKIDLCNCDT